MLQADTEIIKLKHNNRHYEAAAKEEEVDSRMLVVFQRPSRTHVH